MQGEFEQFKSLDEDARRRFESAWAIGEPLRIDACLPEDGKSERLATLEELVHIELEFAWKTGIPTAAGVLYPRTDEYLAAFPELNIPDVVQRLRQHSDEIRRLHGVGSDETAPFPVQAHTHAGSPPGHPQNSNAGARKVSTAGIIGGYEILDRLGVGGMGTVWRATEERTGRTVALKVMKDIHFDSEDFRRRFEREVHLSAKLEHPNIARIYQAGEDGGVMYYALEYLEGDTLTKYVDTHELDVFSVVELMCGICSAVQYAHQRGVIHRDLKPSNILVTSDGQPHVLDFGLAKSLTPAEDDHTLTRAGDIAGTPAYMAPEQASGDVEHMDTRTDIYALGVILYRLLTGRLPHHQARNQLDMLKNVIGGEITRPRLVSDRVDAEVEAILLKALEKKPDDRYDSAASLRSDLQNYLSGDPISARAPTLGYLLRKRFRKHRMAAVLMSAALLIVISAVGFYIVSLNAEKRRTLDAKETAEENARDAAREAENARRAQQLAETREREATWNLYVSRMQAASKAWHEGDNGRVSTLLDAITVDADNHDYRGWEFWCLKWQTERISQLVFPSFGTSVPKIQVVPNSNEVMFSIGTEIQFRSAADWSLVREIPYPHGYAGGEALSPDGKRVAIAMNTGVVYVIDASDGRVIHRIRAHTEYGPGPGGSKASWSLDGKRLATLCMRGDVKVWDAASGQLVRTLYKPKTAEYGGTLAWSHDGRLASGHDQGRVKIWDVDTGKYRQADGPGLKSIIFAAAWSTGGRLAVGSIYGLAIYDSKGASEWIPPHDGTTVHRLCWLDEDRLLAAGENQAVTLWDVSVKKMIRKVMVHLAPITNVEVLADNTTVLTTSTDGEVRTVDLATEHRADWTVARSGRPVGGGIEWSPDGRMCAAIVRDTNDRNHVDIFDAATGTRKQRLSGFREPVMRIAWSPNGKWLASIGHYSEDLVVRDTQSWETALRGPARDPKEQSRTPYQYESQLAWSADAKRLATTSFAAGNTGLDVYSAPSFQLEKHVKNGPPSGSPWPIESDFAIFGSGILVFDGSHVHYKDSRVWTPSSPGHLAIHRGRGIVAVGTDRGSVIFRHLDSLEVIHQLRAHGQRIHSLDWSPDGRRLVTVGANLRIWETNSLVPVLELTSSTGHPFTQAKWSPDGRQLAASSSDELSVWTVDADAPFQKATAPNSGPLLDWQDTSRP